MDFKEIFDNTSDEIKLEFLNAIIKYNQNLQKEFVNYTKQEVSSEESVSPDSFMQKIADIQEQYIAHFESIDLENPDWDNYNPSYSGYIEEWEQYQQASEQEFNQIFEKFKSEIIDMLIQQQIDDFTAMLLGLYEACLNTEIEDDIGSFHDVNEHLTDEHERIMQELTGKIKMSAISSHKANSAIQLFFHYCDEEYSGNPTYPKYFECLLLALADNTDKPNQILSILDASKVERATLPQLVLLLNKNTGNDTEWLQSAQQYYLKDNEVAKQLLDYYFENDKERFIKISNELFDKDKRYWSEFLQDKVSLELDKTLYIKVFYQLTTYENKIEHYHKIKDYLSPTEFNRLIEEIKWNMVFVAQILEVEKKFEEIKQIVEQNPDSWDINELIEPILNVYPEFCFSLIEQKSVNEIENGRGREVYSTIASWLKQAQKIQGFENKTRELINQLYNHKPNLPALKDEFRKAKLV